MGSSSGGGASLVAAKKKYTNYRSRQRANMSFLIVVMFFAVFGVIVFTEIFLIDERGRGAGVLVRHGSLTYHPRDMAPDYDENAAAADDDNDISILIGAPNLKDTVGALLLGRPAALPIIDDEPPPPPAKPLAETLLPPYPSNLTPTPGAWQPVNTSTHIKFLVFSAFFDARKGHRSIRIIAATKTRGSQRIWCRFWYTPDNATANITSRTIPAKIKVIRENWNLKYSACFILCPLVHNHTVPTSVSVVAMLRKPPTNLLAVVNNYNESASASKPTSKFGVCIKPLHFDYNRALQILEFIELNRLMGVAHFTFYNHTIGPQVGCILADYVERGIVTLLPWQLNMLSQKEIRTEGLFAALNDCLYRSMHLYSHVLLIDLDEYIIPRHNDTLQQLIEYLDVRANSRSTGSYSFQNAFFYLQWGDDESVYEASDPVAAGLVTLKKTRRRSKLHPHKQRSKYICRPELVVEAGNHFVWEFIPHYGTMNAPPDTAILHHYRVCEFGGDDCVKTASTVDATAFRYKRRLVAAVGEQFAYFRGRCGLGELAPPPNRVFSRIMSMLKPVKKRFRKTMPSCRTILYAMIILAFMSFYMMRVTMSIAIVSISSNTTTTCHFHLTELAKSHILGIYYYGYMVSPLIAGRLAEYYGARVVLGGALAATAVLTLLTPLTCHTGYYSLLGVQLLLGLFNGAIWSGAYPLAAKWVAPASWAIFTNHMVASSLGSALTLAVCGYLIDWGGWASAFYATGSTGLVMTLLWYYLVYDSPETHPRITLEEKARILKELDEDTIPVNNKKRVPWKKILCSMPVWALIVATFTQYFAFIVVFNEMPGFLAQIFHYNISTNGLLSSLPHLARYPIGLLTAYIMVKIQALTTLTVIRKSVIVSSFILTSGGTLIQIYFGENRTVSLCFFVWCIGLLGVSLGGSLPNALDLSPNFAGTLYGLANSIGASSGFICSGLVGYLTNEVQSFEQWSYVFWVQFGLNLYGAGFYLVFGSGSVQEWNKIKQTKEMVLLKTTNEN